VYNGPPEELDRAFNKLEAYIAHGVTTVLDPQASSLSVFALSDLLESGQILGPRLLSSGDPIYGDEGYQSIAAVLSSPLITPRDADAMAKQRKLAGAAVLKVYSHSRRDHRQWLARAAAINRLNLTAEGACDLSLDLQFVRDGYPAFEHAFPIDVFSDVTQLLGAAQTFYTPTLGAGCHGSLTNHVEDLHVASPTSPPSYTSLHSGDGSSPIGEGLQQALFLARNAVVIQRAGGRLTIGSHGESPGVGTVRELLALNAAGLDPYGALLAGTIVGAAKLGIDSQVGSIVVGKRADLVVLNGNPLTDLSVLLRPALIVLDGVMRTYVPLQAVGPGVREQSTGVAHHARLQ